MANPTTRQEFAEYCLRRLGKPAIEINVTEEQVDDRIDDALKFYWDYHFAGSEKIYYKHLITEQNIADKFITLPENIMGAVSIFDVGGTIAGVGMFDITYQFALNDLYSFTTGSLIPYYMTMQHLSLIQEILVGKQMIRYNRNRNQLFIDMNWNKVQAGQYFVVEAYEVVDPEEFQDVWKDRWLQNYGTACIGVQWGDNLTKFVGMTLPGGVQFNGEAILTKYQTAKDKLEEELLDSPLPPLDMIG